MLVRADSFTVGSIFAVSRGRYYFRYTTFDGLVALWINAFSYKAGAVYGDAFRETEPGFQADIASMNPGIVFVGTAWPENDHVVTKRGIIIDLV